MRIEDFRSRETSNGVSASARLVWEDSDRPSFEAFFDWDGPASTDLEKSANSFLVAAFIPALRDGESRVRVESASVDPKVCEGLRAAAGLFHKWYGDGPAPAIEAASGFRETTPSGHAALFLSGGADSLHALHDNRSKYSESDDDAYRTAIHFLGMALFEDDPGEGPRNLAKRTLHAARRIAGSCGLTLRSIRSNVARLSRDDQFWATHTQGAMLASAALGLPIRRASLAASWDVRGLPPWGSHPHLDPCFSSSSIQIRHVGAEFTRLQKIRDLAAWPVALENMIVCHQKPLPKGELNCGRCEKCLRTVIELLLAGALERAAAFPVRGVSPDAVDALAPTPLRTERFWSDLPEPLEGLGRKDLARAVNRYLRRIRRQRQWEDDGGWIGGLRRIDRQLLGHRLSRLKRSLRS
jgi:hypothetical protein